MSTLAYTKKTNHRMAWKEKESSMGSGKLVVFGSRRLRQEIEDSSSFYCDTNTTGQLSHYIV